HLALRSVGGIRRRLAFKWHRGNTNLIQKLQPAYRLAIGVQPPVLDPAIVAKQVCNGKTGGQIVPYRRRGINGPRPGVLTQHQQASYVINLCIGKQYRSDTGVANMARRLKFGVVTNLLQDIGRSVDQKPVLPIGADGDRRLCAARYIWCVVAQIAAVWTITVPLRKASSSCGSQYFYLH